MIKVDIKGIYIKLKIFPNLFGYSQSFLLIREIFDTPETNKKVNFLGRKKQSARYIDRNEPFFF